MPAIDARARRRGGAARSGYMLRAASFVAACFSLAMASLFSCATRSRAMEKTDGGTPGQVIGVELVRGPERSESGPEVQPRSRYGAWIVYRPGIASLPGGRVLVFAPDGRVLLHENGEAKRMDGAFGGGLIRMVPARGSGAPRFWTLEPSGGVTLRSEDLMPIAVRESSMAFIDGRPGIVLMSEKAVLMFSEEEGKGRRGLRLDRFLRPDDGDGVSAAMPVGSGFRSLIDACLGPGGRVACALVATGSGYELRGFDVESLAPAFVFPVTVEASPSPRGLFATASGYVLWDRRGYVAFKAEGAGPGSAGEPRRIPFSRGAGLNAATAPERAPSGDFTIVSMGPDAAPGTFLALAEIAGSLSILRVAPEGETGLSAEYLGSVPEDPAAPVDGIAAFADGRIAFSSRGALFDGLSDRAEGAPALRPRVLAPFGAEELLCAFEPAGFVLLGKERGADGPVHLDFSIDSIAGSDTEWIYCTGVEAGSSGLYRIPVATLRADGGTERELLATSPLGGRSLIASARDGKGSWLFTDGYGLYLTDERFSGFTSFELAGLGMGGRILSLFPLRNGNFLLLTENGILRSLDPVEKKLAWAAEVDLGERILSACLEPGGPGRVSILAGTTEGRIYRLTPGYDRPRRIWVLTPSGRPGSIGAARGG